MEEEHEIVYTKARHSHDSLHQNINNPDHDKNDDSNINLNLNTNANENEEQDIVHPLPHNPNIHNIHNNRSPQQQFDDDEHDYHLTASIASLDTAVQQTRKRTHLGRILAPGGDYDESHVTPQLMAYMTRLAIYENDYTKPHTVYHTNSTFKKYKSSNNNPSIPKHQQHGNIGLNHEDLKIDECEEDDDAEIDDTQSVMISTSMMKQQSNASNSSSTSSNNSNSTSSSTDNLSEYDITADDHSSEFVQHPDDNTKGIFPSTHTIKEQQKIPAHLHASDEELYLFLRNPPSPPIPFYPPNIHFISPRNSPNSNPNPNPYINTHSPRSHKSQSHSTSIDRDRRYKQSHSNQSHSSSPRKYVLFVGIHSNRDTLQK